MYPVLQCSLVIVSLGKFKPYITKFRFTTISQKYFRSVLERQGVNDHECVSIAFDIIQAMNYLHLFNPPIIHRDISSANILLYRVGYTWRGKLSDYGSLNFMRQANTHHPGAPLYCAPEFKERGEQTPKVFRDSKYIT